MKCFGWLFSLMLIHSCSSADYTNPDLGQLMQENAPAVHGDTQYPYGPSQYQYIPTAYVNIEHQKIRVLIFNAFPNLTVSARVLFEEDDANGLAYGKHNVKQVPKSSADFLIEFFKSSTKDHVRGFTDYGFIKGDLKSQDQILMVIRRKEKNMSKPKHSIMMFPAVEHPSSKLYVFNAIWNKEEPEEGFYVYGVYKKRNSDGTVSDSLMKLAADLPMNEGIDADVVAGTRMTIKAFYKRIGSVSEFKRQTPVASLGNFMPKAGERGYLIAFGNYPDMYTDFTPQLRLINQTEINSATGVVYSNYIHVFCILSTLMHTLLA